MSKERDSASVAASKSASMRRRRGPFRTNFVSWTACGGSAGQLLRQVESDFEALVGGHDAVRQTKPEGFLRADPATEQQELLDFVQAHDFRPGEDAAVGSDESEADVGVRKDAFSAMTTMSQREARLSRGPRPARSLRRRWARAR